MALRIAKSLIRVSSWGAGFIGFTVLLTTGLAILNLWTYQRLTSEIVVGQISFEQHTSQRFAATLQSPDGRPMEFLLHGDEWQLDVRMIKWAPWLALLGREPLFRLERLSGRFNDIEQANKQALTIYSLSENPGLDLWAFARRHPDWLPAVDAVYGSSVYLPMNGGVSYRITLGQTGLIARPLDSEVKKALLERWN